MFHFLKTESTFSRLLWAHAASRIGDGVHELIFVLLAMEATQNNLQALGWIYFFRFCPYLFGPIGGIIADWYDTKKIMLFSDIGRFILVAMLCIAAWLDKASPALLSLIGLFITGHRMLFQPAFQATTPRIVHPNNLIQANGCIQVATEIGGLIGPAFAGFLLLFLNKPLVLMLDSMSYLISFCLILRVQFTERGQQVQRKLEFTILTQELIGSVKEFKKSKQLSITILFSAICIFFVGAVLRVLIPAHAKSIVNHDSFVGLVMSVIGLGTIIGAYIFSKKSSQNQRLRLDECLGRLWCYFSSASLSQ